MERAKLVQRARLVPAFLVLPGELEGLAGVLPGLLPASRQPTDLAELGDSERMVGQVPHEETCSHRLLQQRQPLREAPGERIRSAQVRGDPGTRPGCRQPDRGPGPVPAPGWRAPGPLARYSRPTPQIRMDRLKALSAASARRSASSPLARPSANAPARPRHGQPAPGRAPQARP